MRFPDPRTFKSTKTEQPAAEDDRDGAAMAVIVASAELKMHGVPRDREARKRLEAVLGDIKSAKADDGEASGRYDPLRYNSGNPLKYGMR